MGPKGFCWNSMNAWLKLLWDKFPIRHSRGNLIKINNFGPIFVVTVTPRFVITFLNYWGVGGALFLVQDKKRGNAPKVHQRSRLSQLRASQVPRSNKTSQRDVRLCKWGVLRYVLPTRDTPSQGDQALLGEQIQQISIPRIVHVLFLASARGSQMWDSRNLGQATRHVKWWGTEAGQGFEIPLKSDTDI